jgi:hypothetical protein
LHDLNNRKDLAILDEKVPESSNRNARVFLLVVDILVTFAQGFFPEFLDLLSPGEEPVANQLIHIQSEAVIEHGGLEKHLLCWDKIISDHEFVGLILDDIIFLVEFPRDEGIRLVLLQIDSCLCLLLIEPSVVPGDGGKRC